MIHYLIVRKDLPFGVTLAQLSHAAADSMAAWYDFNGDLDFDMYPQEGHCNCRVERPHYGNMTIVVLGVKNKRVLLSWIRRLTKANIHHSVVREPDAPYNGDATAIGVWPGEREKLEPFFEELEIYKELGDKE